MKELPVRKQYYLLWWLFLAIAWLPFPVLYLISDVLYGLLFYITGYRKKVVFQNLQRSFPEKNKEEHLKIAKQFYRNLTDILVETIKLAVISPEQLKKRVQILNPEVIEAETSKGKLVLAMGGHQGNWEWAPSGGIPFLNCPIDVVYKPLSNTFFEAFVYGIRTRLGPNLVRMKDSLRFLIQHKKQPRLFCMLSDQTPPKSEIQYWTTFMNQYAGFFVGGEKLAASFHMPVFFIHAQRVGRGYYNFKFIPIEPAGAALQSDYPITEQFARMLETWIHENPSDYLWSHRRWKHERPVGS
ncbi:lysophospholipid acyltransferase family protein [Adhaeribacter radiodurans]|uniref:Lysophospholipid acyltransferase family protein n=1 Tax=Adhaeribacter radiodurans TaxID=2745197 RepID=A0A7L7L8V1_9BACT|nr:lysophospholipid acyltransferase family protein [Adhaeribacter radiodurans]QMU29262.1 lysophospholipid acyltransferase family protein [Adhaeribacter radiodurans]